MHADPAMLGVSQHPRAPRDWYPTIDENVTHALARVLLAEGYLTKRDTIWECAAGDWAMGRVLEQHFDNVWGSDIEPQAANINQLDFLNSTPSLGFDAIITNPPFGDLVTDFMDRGVYHIRQGNAIFAAMLGRNELDTSGRDRAHLFGNCPEYVGKIVLTWRPRWFEKKQGDNGPRFNYAWYLWGERPMVKRQGGPRLYYAGR